MTSSMISRRRLRAGLASTASGREEVSLFRFAFHDSEFIPNPDAEFFSKFDYQKYKKVGKGEILPTRIV